MSNEARRGQKRMSSKAKKKYEKRNPRTTGEKEEVPSVEGLNI